MPTGRSSWRATPSAAVPAREELIPLRVRLLDPEVTLEQDQPATIEIEVTNDLEVIDGVSAALVDEPGVSCSVAPALLPLFPDGTGRILLELRCAPTYRAGTHQLRVELHSAVGEGGARLETVSVVVPPRPGAVVSVDPPVRSARHRAEYRVRVENTGNTELEAALAASDPTRASRASFVRPQLRVGPGEGAWTAMRSTAKRRFLGNETSHQLTVLATAGELEVDTKAVFRQRPLVPRGARTVVILGTIVALWAAVFAVVLNRAFSKDPLTKQVPASFYAPISHKAGQAKLQSLGGSTVGLTAANAATPAGAVPKSGVVIGVGGTISGTVDAKSTGAGVGRISVEAVQDGPSGPTTVASAATTSKGTYSIQGLLPGSYKLLFEAQGYQSRWYPNAPSASGAKAVTVDALATTGNVNVVLQGQPGSITGMIDTGQKPAPPVTITVEAQQGSATAPVATVKSNAAGAYTIPNLATPGQYDLSFSAKGYQVASASDELRGGEALIANTITLSAGTGSISGTVLAGGSPLGGVSITAKANGQTYTSATPTTGPVGEFSLTGLPSPATYLLTFQKAGYGTRVIGEQLGPGQARSNQKVVLEGGAGDISGTVTSASGQDLGGATVTVDGGSAPVTTKTLTAGTVGAYSLSGLSTPGTYTLTFSLTGYQSQTVAVPLASSGSATNVNVKLPLAVGTITGTVTSSSGTPLTGVTVSATNGTKVTTTKSTSEPAGGFLLSGLSPGSYSITFSLSGYSDETYLVDLAPGASSTVHAELAG